MLIRIDHQSLVHFLLINFQSLVCYPIHTKFLAVQVAHPNLKTQNQQYTEHWECSLHFYFFYQFKDKAETLCN